MTEFEAYEKTHAVENRIANMGDLELLQDLFVFVELDYRNNTKLTERYGMELLVETAKRGFPIYRTLMIRHLRAGGNANNFKYPAPRKLIPDNFRGENGEIIEWKDVQRITEDELESLPIGLYLLNDDPSLPHIVRIRTKPVDACLVDECRQRADGLYIIRKFEIRKAEGYVGINGSFRVSTNEHGEVEIS